MIPRAEILADSISPQGCRLSTLQVVCHRYILVEINTHRALSRSWRSSRAVPVRKLLAEVRHNPAEPIEWRAERPGMVAGNELEGPQLERAQRLWRRAASYAADFAEELAQCGLHKSWANRGLEPYTYAHGVISATEWSNFFSLRLADDAQPEFRALAAAVNAAICRSKPVLLHPGEWHLPYVRNEDVEDVDGDTKALRKISAARCARTSYLTHDERRPRLTEDLMLSGRLLAEHHMSPFEHQATPDEDCSDATLPEAVWASPETHANYVGWRQSRHLLKDLT